MKVFGPIVVTYSKVQKAIPVILANTNAQARKTGMNLGCEIYRWMGAVYIEQLPGLGLKSTQEKEFTDKLFPKIKDAGKAIPEKNVRGVKGKAKSFNPLDLIESTDLMKELSEDWNEKVVSKKWKDKKDAVEELMVLLPKVTKIKLDGSFVDLMGTMQKLVKDTNVNVLNAAIKTVLMIIEKTEKKFSPFAKKTLLALLPTLKEKKLSIAKPMNDACDLLFQHCLKLTDFMEPMCGSGGFFEAKVPFIRQSATALVLRCLKNPKCDGGKAGVKQCSSDLGFALVKLVSDGDAVVRKNLKKQ
eukprot:TRINITY_DN699_c0_g1_i1.p1 TRINITY_DN699_c0_g1~~TRINITY_DN699_c0_g1_i1.p1  ORF type:complete len:301 (+),score=57.28 TRINITY_DN699_c0_g1_i1:508-1410(+)